MRSGQRIFGGKFYLGTDECSDKEIESELLELVEEQKFIVFPVFVCYTLFVIA